MKIIEMPIETIIPYTKNPRKNDQAVVQVARSIQEFGFKVPVIIDKNNEIVAGHTRVKAAKKLGFASIPCIIADDLTPEQIKAYRLADNKTGEIALWDDELLALELDGLNMDMSQFGFDLLSPDGFGEDFTLPDGDKSEFEQMTFTLHTEQAGLIRYAMTLVEDDIKPDAMFRNTNKNGNALYEVIRQWAAQRK